jgi:hypothetical protein
VPSKSHPPHHHPAEPVWVCRSPFAAVRAAAPSGKQIDLPVPVITKTATSLSIGDVTVPIKKATNEALVPSILFYDVPVRGAFPCGVLILFRVCSSRCALCGWARQGE